MNAVLCTNGMLSSLELSAFEKLVQLSDTKSLNFYTIDVMKCL